MPGEIYINTCACTAAPGTTPPALAPYVVSLQNLQGIITLNGTGVLDISTSGNTINFGLAAGSGLGTVTSVAASSSNSNLVIGGSPITTFGTLAFSFAGALNSISGLVTVADQMIYTTAADTYATTSLTAFARTLLDDAAATNARTTLGVVIGTDVQAFSSDLADFVTNASWTGTTLVLVAGLNVGTTINCTDLVADSNIATTLGDITSGNDMICGGVFTGNGSGITNINGDNIATGTVGVTVGGTNISSYTTGDLLYANSGTSLAKLAAGAAGTFLRFAGAGVAPVVSTLILPNAATVGDIFSSSTTNTMSRITAVATGNVLLSGGVATLPAWGKVTSSHVDSTLATISAGSNSNITSMGTVTFRVAETVTFNSDTVAFNGSITDGAASEGNGGDLLTSQGSGLPPLWSTQITIDTLTLNTNFGLEGTITGAGTTGAQTINKPCGTVRFAAAASSLVVTNSLCTTSHRVLAMACTNDTTATVKNVVTTTGSFTIVLEAAATAETEVYWELRQIT